MKVLQNYYKPGLRQRGIPQDAIEQTQSMLLRMECGKEVEKKTGCKGRVSEVMLQRCDTESMALKGGGEDGRTEGVERGRRIHAQ